MAMPPKLISKLCKLDIRLRDNASDLKHYYAAIAAVPMEPVLSGMHTRVQQTNRQFTIVRSVMDNFGSKVFWQTIYGTDKRLQYLKLLGKGA